MEKPSRAGGTRSFVPVAAATAASWATAAVRGQRPSRESATSISCVGVVSSGVGSKEYSSRVARCSTFMMFWLYVVRGKMCRKPSGSWRRQSMRALKSSSCAWLGSEPVIRR